MIDFRRLLTSHSPGVGVRILRWLLRVASLPYALAVAARNAAYDLKCKEVFRSRLPVVSVGNLSVGGTGKSPTVAWLAAWFRGHDIRVAILSRGYGQLDSGQNDEALELEQQLPDVPHLQNADRVASARLADEELDMQLLLLDDGFQHRRLARDLDIVLLDATDPPSAHWLLPGGLLREPMSSMSRADIVLLTRTDQVSTHRYERLKRLVRRYAPRAKVVAACHKMSRLIICPNEQRDASQLKGKRLLAFCAIGNPDAFFRGLEELGSIILDRKTWRDHHAFDADDIACLSQWTEQFPEAEQLICTMKDWVKIQVPSIGRLELAAVAVELHISEGRSEFESALEEIRIACLRAAERPHV